MNPLRLRHLAPLALLTAACHGPAAIAEQYHEALSRSDGSKALGLLSEKTRAELTQIAKKASEASGGTLSADPALMITSGDASIYPRREKGRTSPVKATLVSSDGKRARVSVALGQGQHELELVKESLRWRIELPLTPPSAVAPAPAPAAPAAPAAPPAAAPAAPAAEGPDAATPAAPDAPKPAAP